MSWPPTGRVTPVPGRVATMSWRMGVVSRVGSRRVTRPLSRVVALCRRTPAPARATAHRIAGLLNHVARIADRIVALPGCVRGPYCTPRPAVSRYNLLYRDPDWKMGSSPSSLLHFFFMFYFVFFFSLIFVFILFHLLEDHKKKCIYIFFHFPVEQNKFIKIFFLFFFLEKTHCKTLKKNISP